MALSCRGKCACSSTTLVLNPAVLYSTMAFSPGIGKPRAVARAATTRSIRGPSGITMESKKTLSVANFTTTESAVVRNKRLGKSDGKAQPLVPDIIPAFQPALSPDGEWVAFGALRGGNSDIWKAKLNGDSLTQLTKDSANDHHPQWSPDGKSIVFASDRSGNWDIWMANCDGSGARQITNAPELDVQPMVSPDGTLIAFMSDRSGKRDIWLIPIGGGQARRFTHDGTNSWPSFSPDSKHLVWSSTRKAQDDLYVAKIADH